MIRLAALAAFGGALWSMALSLSPPPALADAAEDCLKGGDAAIAGCSALIDKDPSDGAAYLNRGKAYFDKADYAKASADLTEAIAIDPTDAKAYVHRGNAYLKMDKGGEAVADFNQALALDPGNADAKAALDKAAADLKDASTAAAPATPEPVPGAERSADGEDSALPASPPAPPVEPGSSPNKSSDMAVFVPDLPEEPGGAEPAPQTWPATPVAAKNYADETTDWGVKEQTVLKKDLGKKTPMVLPGARRITTPELQQIGPRSLLIDVLDDTDHHITLPGAVHMPGAGNYGGGRFNDKLQKKFAKALAEATNDNRDRQLVFFCYGAECWESYNAGLRAIEMGYHNVLWYRGGLQSWKDAELPLAPPAETYPVR